MHSYQLFASYVQQGILEIGRDNEVYRVKDRYLGTWRPVDARLFGRIGDDGYVKGVFKDEQGHRHDIILHVALWVLRFGALPDGYQINHRSGIRHDNRWENLELVTRRENIEHRDLVLKGRTGGRVENAYTRKRDWVPLPQELPPWLEPADLQENERVLFGLIRQGRYRVYPDGRVVTVTFEGEFNACNAASGRRGNHRRTTQRVFFSTEGRVRSVQAHRIVYLMFAGMVRATEIINHLDGDPCNNAVENLEVTDHQGNHDHRVQVLGHQARGSTCHQAELTEPEVILLWKLLRRGDFKQADLARLFRVTPAAISRIKGGQVWLHLLAPLEQELANSGENRNVILNLTAGEVSLLAGCSERTRRNPRQIAPRGSRTGPAVLDESAVAVIWWLLKATSFSLAAIGRSFGVGLGTIHAIAHKRNWAWFLEELEKEFERNGLMPAAVDERRFQVVRQQLENAQGRRRRRRATSVPGGEQGGRS